MQLNSKAYLSALVSKIKTWALANWPILLVLILAFAVRLYFINVNQAVWWDEAQYLMLAKHYVFGTPIAGWYEGRSPLFSLMLASLFYIFGNTELPARFLMSLMSVTMVYLTYAIGKKLYGWEVGVFAAAIFAVFWEVLFTTFRILLDLPAAFFLLVSVYFFVNYVKENKPKSLFFCGIFFGVASLMRFDNGLMALPYTIILLLMKRFKSLLILGTTTVITIIPQLFYDFVNYGSPFHSMLALLAPMNIVILSRHYPLLTYVTGLYSLFGLVIFPLFILSIVYATYRIKRVNTLILLLPAITFLLVLSVAIVEDPRFFVRIFPMIFILAGAALFKTLDKVFQLAKIDNKKIIYVIFFAVVIIAMITQLNVANLTIGAKANSYVEVKEGAFWLKEHTSPDENVMSNAPPFMSYYAERQDVGLLKTNESEFLESLTQNNVRYILVSGYELRSTDPAYIAALPSQPYLEMVSVINLRNTDQGAVFIFEVNQTLLEPEIRQF